MEITLYVWRQKGPQDAGRLVRYEAKDITPDMSFLEMLDVVNEELVKTGVDPIAFDHDCREGICGMCAQVINGIPRGAEEDHHLPAAHAPLQERRHHLRRAAARPRLPRDQGPGRGPGSLDKIIQSGGYISAHTGGVPDGNAILIPKDDADKAMDAAECIGCGACVAACPNGSAMLSPPPR